ncbi:hypothetical protein Ahy_A01g002852 [Arachis hypogaea]|uniref:beta-galactosidase n=1 Tax=Arachis hypogaea TaxID=3818 RepID=A0A445ERM8_ARAHY|nr:hypothetical protein Ahy_A01g002852 [Arachis hypogaea]
MESLVMSGKKLCVMVLCLYWVHAVTAFVTYDHKAILVNRQRKILFFGFIHYPRSTPQGGLDVIQTYVCWNGHEPSPGKNYFEDRYNLVKFIKVVQQAGLYVNLQIGPYICSEWNFG